jgi:hypothetical protein
LRHQQRFWSLSSRKESKETPLAYAMWLLCFVGMCGVQRLYLGQTGLGLAMLFTLGFCGIGQFFDLFLIPQAVEKVNNPPSDSLAKSLRSVVTTSASSSAQQSPRDDVSASSMDELDSLLKEAQNSLEQTQTQQKPTDHHGS